MTFQVTYFLFILVLSLQIYFGSAVCTLRESRAATPECTASLSECLTFLSNPGTLVSECDVLPTAPNARALPVAPEGYNLTELRPGVFSYYDGFYNCLMMADGDNFLFMDFPDSMGSNVMGGSGTRLTDAAEVIIGDVIPSRIYMVYSHSHFDHIGAGTRFFNYFNLKYPETEIDIWATASARDMIAMSITNRAPMPNELIRDTPRTIVLGETIEYEMSELLGHSDSDLVGYVKPSGEEPGIIYYVDILFPRYAPFQNLGSADEVRDYLAVHTGLLAFDFKYMIPGHLFVGTREDLEINLEYTNDLLEAARQAFIEDKSEEIGFQLAKFQDPNADEFGNHAFLSDFVFRGAVRNVCIRLMLEKWGCLIGGVDLTIFDNCTSAFLFLMIDQ